MVRCRRADFLALSFPAHEVLQWNTGIQVMCDRGVLEVRNDADGFRASTEDLGQVVLDQSGWATIHNEPRGAFGRCFGTLSNACAERPIIAARPQPKPWNQCVRRS